MRMNFYTGGLVTPSFITPPTGQCQNNTQGSPINFCWCDCRFWSFFFVLVLSDAVSMTPDENVQEGAAW